MIYFDNAATGWPKPPKVSAAVCEALRKAGNPGRGAHSAASWAAQKVYSVREQLAALFSIEDPLRIAFTLNATHALNIAVNLCRGEIITTSMDHNSVLRPVTHRGYYSIVRADCRGHISPSEVLRKISDLTGAVIMTHGSNVTGEVYDIEPIGAACRKRGILFIVDCAQTAGIIPIDAEKMKIDVLCFSGHKGLLGPQGTGGIYIREGVPVRPFMLGGTGSRSFQLTQPCEMPDCFESGTVNTHGIAGLGAGVSYISQLGQTRIRQKEQALRAFFVRKMRELPQVTVYGPEKGCFTGTVSVNVRGMESGETAELLARQGIGVRGGFHCAPLAHKSLGTDQSGTVRFSFGSGNTRAEVEKAAAVMQQIVAGKHNI